MPIENVDLIRNFYQVQVAAKNGHLALVQGLDMDTGEEVHLICAVYTEEGEQKSVPFASLVTDSNPFEKFIPKDAPGYEEACNAAGTSPRNFEEDPEVKRFLDQLKLSSVEMSDAEEPTRIIKPSGFFGVPKTKPN